MTTEPGGAVSAVPETKPPQISETAREKVMALLRYGRGHKLFDEVVAARFSLETYIAQMENDSRLLARLEMLVEMGSLRVAADGVRLSVWLGTEAWWESKDTLREAASASLASSEEPT